VKSHGLFQVSALVFCFRNKETATKLIQDKCCRSEFEPDFVPIITSRCSVEILHEDQQFVARLRFTNHKLETVALKTFLSYSWSFCTSSFMM